MIGPEFLLFSNRSKDSNIFYDLLLLVLIVPILGQITSYLKDNIPKYMNKLYYKFSKQSVIEFVGYDKIDYGEFIPTYPEAMLSVFRWTIHQKKVKSLRYYNKQRGLWEKCRDEGLTDLNYMIIEGKNIELEEGLYMDVDHQKLDDPSLKKTVDLKTNKLTLNLRSAIHNTEYINKFVNKCIKFNREYELGLNKNKLYHFIFKGYDNNYQFNECFHIGVLKEYDNEKYINKSKPFDNLFFDNKEKLIKRLDKLKDLEYYERTGSRRKVGFLFYGPAGCGKTKSVEDIAEKYKRHIIEVPMSRIKKNSDIEELFNLTKIGCTEFKKEDIIFLFDEIDQLGKILHDRNIDSEKKESDKKDKKSDKKDKEIEEKDKFENSEDSKENGLTKVIKEYMSMDSCKPNTDDSINLGTLLSRLDGIGNYDGLITIATTNCIEKLDSALKRPGRLDPYLFDYASKSNIIDIIEKFLQVKLSEEYIQRLPDRDSSLSHTTIIKLTQEYEEDLEGLVSVLETFNKS
jgi:hypothetical protein